MNPRLADEGGFVVASLIRMVLVLLVVGLVIVEGGSILFASLQLQDAADAAALNAADELKNSRSAESAEEAATEALERRDAEAVMTQFEVLPDGGVRLHARTQASTILVHRIRPIDDLAVVEATATGRPVSGGI